MGLGGRCSLSPEKVMRGAAAAAPFLFISQSYQGVELCCAAGRHQDGQKPDRAKKSGNDGERKWVGRAHAEQHG